MTVRHRQDAIIRHLRRNGSATVAELAQVVGASRRTVLRDIGALREEGYVIDTDPGRGGGVRLDAQSVRTIARLSVSEVFALILGIAAMRAARSLPFQSLADSGLARIEAALPADRLRDLREFMACLYVGEIPPRQDLSNVGQMDPDLLSAFEGAFLQRQHLRFTYTDAKGRQTERIVEPQAMLILPPLWYMVAWDPARDDFRHFRMDRIAVPERVEGTNFRRRHVPFAADVSPYSGLPPYSPSSSGAS
ncbi:HTH domain protein [Rhodobacteraceae bacterium THAF1]|uniref:helix-turn-helix transcriptional regulator n=1 Tax=Palleronia sp. THAF1 TaxID=2587842 RepID=UPI000F40A623|nr:WYL domain-containing protein [Palleronia sp. THAF1]QFU09764.1 HTH domain protein [Palleronia sp. THAF1]VDC17333.1 HTH domain protein [Rhodobacteraceae bacterium THAF1]